MTKGRGLVLGALTALATVGVSARAEAQLLERASSAVRGSSSSSSRSDDDDRRGSVLGQASDSVRGERSSARGSAGDHYGESSASEPWDEWSSSPRRRYVDDVEAEPSDVHADLLVRLDLELGYVLAGAGRAGLGARVQLPFLIDLVTRYSIFVEPSEPGALVVALGRVGADVRLVDLAAFQFRIGGALRHFHDARGAVFGGDFAIGVDIFPGEPVVISADAAAGVLGQAAVVQARAQVGLVLDSVELYVGYHYEALFAAGAPVDLGGPMAGVRGWL